MKRRHMKGIPGTDVHYGDVDPSPFAPLHRRLGIRTFVHRQAILNDPRTRAWDRITRSWSHQHLFRESITLAAV
jgi:hypothetical protein